jgi:hypothetical protein
VAGRPAHVASAPKLCPKGVVVELKGEIVEGKGGKEGESGCDVDINIGDTSTPTHNQISGPITRARARQLNNQVSSFLASYSSYLDNGNVCSVLLLRNDGQEGNRVGFARATFGF